MQIAATSDVGKKRASNQDRFCLNSAGENAYAIVCDGMGGHVGGETASGLAVAALKKAMDETLSSLQPETPVQAKIKAAFEQANRVVFAETLKNTDLAGMGTTAVCAFVRGTTLYVAHVGDSRAYLYRDGLMLQLTKDHSFVQQMIDLGEITREQAEKNPYKHLITRALGSSAEVEVDEMTVSLMPDDRVLLCSDGLYNMVRFEKLTRALGAAESAQDLCDGLVAEANDNGGTDNITVAALLPDICK